MEELNKIKALFNTQKKGNTHCFSLDCWTDGMWSLKVTDSWQNWLYKDIPELNYKYATPKQACDAFLEHVNYPPFKEGLRQRPLVHQAKHFGCYVGLVTTPWNCLSSMQLSTCIKSFEGYETVCMS